MTLPSNGKEKLYLGANCFEGAPFHYAACFRILKAKAAKKAELETTKTSLRALRTEKPELQQRLSRSGFLR